MFYKVCFFTVVFVGWTCVDCSRPRKYVEGLEIDKISRGSLLKILAAMESSLGAGQKTRPMFTAEFANNKQIRPFVYPEMMTDEISEEPKFWTKTSLLQLGYGVWVSLTLVNVGLATGFPAVTIPQLVNTSDIVITTSDESWIASILTLVAPVGCVLCGVVADRYGRRVILIFSQIPMLVGWIYTGSASTAEHIIIGRIITGVGCGMVMSVPTIYSSEISLPNMRGMIGAFPSLAMSIGLTLQAIIGANFDWDDACFGCGVYTIVIGIFNYFLPETPYFILLKGNEDCAKASLMKFRSDSYDIREEYSELMEYQQENNLHRLSLWEEIKLLFTKAACWPFWFIFTYNAISQLAGIGILFVWAIDFLEASKSSIDPNAGYFILGITRFLSSILSSIVMYKFGRRPQALISSLGVGIVCMMLGSIIHFKTKPTVYPQFCYVMFVVFATLGYYALPLLLMGELYPLQIRGLMSGISVAILNFMAFGVNYAFPYLRNTIGHANIILCFGTSSLLGTIFLYFYLPETKGLTLQEIEEYFNGRRPTLVSQKSVLAVQMSQAKIQSELKQSRSKLKSAHKNRSLAETLQLKKQKTKDNSRNNELPRNSNDPVNSKNEVNKINEDEKTPKI